MAREEYLDIRYITQVEGCNRREIPPLKQDLIDFTIRCFGFEPKDPQTKFNMSDEPPIIERIDKCNAICAQIGCGFCSHKG